MKPSLKISQLWNQSGMSLMEIMISLGLLGGLAAAGFMMSSHLNKSSKEMDSQLSGLAMEKLLEGHLMTQRGCRELEGKGQGDGISFRIGPNFVGPGGRLGGVDIVQVGMNEFVSAGSEDSGVAKIFVDYKRSQGQSIRKEFLIPVNMHEVDGRPVVESCRLTGRRAFQEIVAVVCGESFGTLSNGLTCAEVVSLVERRITQSVCQDISGINPASFDENRCNLESLHANKSCPSNQVLVGFDDQGQALCSPYVQRAFASTPLPPIAVNPANSPVDKDEEEEGTNCWGRASWGDRDCRGHLIIPANDIGMRFWGPNPPQSGCRNTNPIEGGSSYRWEMVGKTKTEAECRATGTHAPVEVEPAAPVEEPERRGICHCRESNCMAGSNPGAWYRSGAGAQATTRQQCNQLHQPTCSGISGFRTTAYDCQWIER